MEHSTFPVLSDIDARWLMSHRSCLPKKMFMSIKGRITCLGEKMRVKNEDLFLIELGYGVFIFVKDFHHYWHSLLLPQDIVVFYELRLTTMKKGVSTPQPILAAMSPSRISKIRRDEDIVCCTLEEWLSVMHLEDTFSSMKKDDDHTGDDSTALPFYGKVTSVAEAGDGIYELDGNMRLYTLSHPAVIEAHCLRVGCDIQVYNAHEVENAGGKTLVCCARTLIRSQGDPMGKANVDSENKERSAFCTLEDLKMTIAKYRLNYGEVERLIHLRDSLKDRARKELAYLLHQVTKSLCPLPSKDDHVSIGDMFMQHTQYCPFDKSKSSGCRIRKQVTVTQLKETKIISNENDVESRTADNYHTWRYLSREWKNEEMLLGRIAVEEGQTVFVDQSGKIPVVLVDQCNERLPQGAPSSSPDSSTGPSKSHENPQRRISHICSVMCQKYYVPTEKLLCPYFTDKISGKMIHVTDFHFVTENCTVKKSGCEKSYLIFSLQDCVVLDKVYSSPPSNVLENAVVQKCHPSGGYSNLENYVVGNDSHLGCYFYVSHKDHLLTLDRQGHSFLLHGRMIDPSLFTATGNSGGSKISAGDKIGSRCDNFGDNVNSYEMSMRMKWDNLPPGPANKRMKTLHPEHGFQTGNSAQNIQDTTVQDHLSKSVLVSMRFDKENIDYFPSLRPGHCYQFTLAKDEEKATHAFQPAFSNEKLGKAVSKCGAKIHMHAPGDLKITQAVCDNSLVDSLKVQIDREDRQVPVSFEQVSSAEFLSPLVSFTAVVINREIQRSPFASSKGDGNSWDLRDVRLDLCALDSHLSSCGDQSVETISLYFSSSYMRYVLGLVPGSVLDIERVERKVSKNNTVYCRFIPVSSLHARYFVHQQNQNRSANASSNPLDMRQFTREFIGTIWNAGPGDRPNARPVTWLIQCHVCVVFSLKLELVCKKCSAVFNNGQCQRHSCGNTSFNVIVNSVVLVEDGTCQAVVKLRSPDLVRKFLTLDEQQWGDVVSLLQSLGRIFISKTASNGDCSSSSPIGMFLNGLVTSSLVLRPVAMLVRVFKDSPCRGTVDKMDKKDFKTKHFRHGKLSFETLHLPYLNLDCVDIEEGPCHY